jgi:hypothetical protein
MDLQNIMYKLFLILIYHIYFFIIKTNGNYINSTYSRIKFNIKKEENFSINKTKQKINYIESSFIKVNDSNFDNISKIEKKNLLIGAVRNYNWSIIEPFFESFKKAGFKNCDFVVYFDGMNEFTINKIKSYGVITYKIQKKYKKKRIIYCRWKIYEEFLKDKGDKYNLVFTADFRDVFFQKDVFQYYDFNKSYLGIAIEDGFLSERISKMWLISAYGENLYKTLRHKRIICIGTVWGTVDKFTELSRIMWKKLNSKWALRNKIVFEQALFTYLIYYAKLFHDCLIKSDNKNGFVMTIGLTNKTDIRLDNEKNVLNGEGKIAAVIHQYDRKDFIVRIVKNKFCQNKMKKINFLNEIKNYNFLIKMFLISLGIIIILIFIVLANNSCKLVKWPSNNNSLILVKIK